MFDWLRLWPELIRLNLQKARHRRRLQQVRQHVGTYPLAVSGPAPCQSASDSGRAGITRCEACHCVRRASRYRWVCPALSIRGNETLCTADSTAIRPLWGRATLALLIPPLTLVLLLALGTWSVLRHQGLSTLPLLDVLLPTRWSHIAEARRTHFHTLMLEALARDDHASAGIALFSAAQTGVGTPTENQRLARLATLGGHHGLADQIHVSSLNSHPEQALAITLAWHDDLLIADRPAELARLALDQLARPDASRGFWLRAWFESIRHPGVAKNILADPLLALPHPGLRHALAAAAALDQGQSLVARDQLLALAGLPPGPEVRRFLAIAWLDLGDPAAALAAAFDTSHPAPRNEPALLSYLIQKRMKDNASAAHSLHPLLERPDSRSALIAALIRDPDPTLIERLYETVTLSPTPDPTLHGGLWLAARRAGSADLANRVADTLAAIGHAVPESLHAVTFSAHDRAAMGLAGALLPLDRDSLYALRAPRP